MPSGLPHHAKRVGEVPAHHEVVLRRKGAPQCLPDKPKNFYPDFDKSGYCMPDLDTPSLPFEAERECEATQESEMANRSYLYSTDHLPESEEWKARKILHGISEYRFDIPLVFKLLLTGNPAACRSSIWETSDRIAIAGDYAQGLEYLASYLGRITDPAARPVINEALQFLNEPAHARKHFILECGEIFELTDGDLVTKNADLLAEIKRIGSTLDSLPLPKPASLHRGLLSRLLRTKPKDPLFPYYDIGLGGWSEILYFDFSQNEA